MVIALLAERGFAHRGSLRGGGHQMALRRWPFRDFCTQRELVKELPDREAVTFSIACCDLATTR